jgi:RNA polymerase sigma factor (sigma-70 family)
MASAPFSPVLRYIHRIAAGQASHLSDSDLLDRFAEGHDEEAFAALVRRHGRLVFGVCRRTVQDWHAAEDCFQAVFLVLAMKARTLSRTESLGPWLHGVAIRVALKAKAQATTRRNIEQKFAVNAEVDRSDDLVWRDLRPVLDDAVASLASKYRIPFVLCYLQGRTVVEIARELGQPKGTVAAQLARAREQLRHRLVRRGITLSVAGLSLALTESLATASVPSALAAGTIKSAGLVAAGRAAVAAFIPNQTAALMEGAMRSMFLTKLKVVGALAVIALGSALFGYHGLLAEQPQDKAKAKETTGVSKSVLPRAPVKFTPWHDATIKIYDVDEEGVKTPIALPRCILLDKQEATIKIGEEIKVGEKSLFQGLHCVLKLTMVDKEKVQVEASVTRNDKVIILENGARSVAEVSQIISTIKAGDPIEFELNAREPNKRIRIDTKTHTDSSYPSAVDLGVTPPQEVPAKAVGK